MMAAWRDYTPLSFCRLLVLVRNHLELSVMHCKSVIEEAAIAQPFQRTEIFLHAHLLGIWSCEEYFSSSTSSLAPLSPAPVYDPLVVAPSPLPTPTTTTATTTATFAAPVVQVVSVIPRNVINKYVVPDCYSRATAFIQARIVRKDGSVHPFNSLHVCFAVVQAQEDGSAADADPFWNRNFTLHPSHYTDPSAKMIVSFNVPTALLYPSKLGHEGLVGVKVELFQLEFNKVLFEASINDRRLVALSYNISPNNTLSLAVLQLGFRPNLPSALRISSASCSSTNPLLVRQMTVDRECKESNDSLTQDAQIFSCSMSVTPVNKDICMHVILTVTGQQQNEAMKLNKKYKCFFVYSQ